MYKLWLFILRYRAFFFFIIFETLSVILLLSGNNYQETETLTIINEFTGNVYKKSEEIRSYFQLSAINDSLRNENAVLRGFLPSAYYDNETQTIIKNDTLKDNDSIKIQRYTYIAAKVINNTISYRNNYITIDKGRLHGVNPGMSVIGPKGIAGIVKNVSPHFSVIMSLLHKDVKVSVKLAETNDIGSLQWQGGSYSKAVLTDIPNHVITKAGEKVFTTGYSIFPENILVGYVIHAPLQTGESLLNVDVALTTDFSHLKYVYVVSDKFSAEKKEAESIINHD